MKRPALEGGCAAILSVVVYFALWVVAWLLTSIKVATPWLVGMGMVKWAAAVVSLAGLGFAFFWVALFLGMALVALLGVVLDD